MRRQLVRRCSRHDRRDHYRRPGSSDQRERVCHGERRHIHNAGERNTPWPALPAHQDGGDNPERDKDHTGDESIDTGISEREPNDLSLIHISEPTRPERIAFGVVGV